jgi:hypothetical protein
MHAFEGMTLAVLFAALALLLPVLGVLRVRHGVSGPADRTVSGQMLLNVESIARKPGGWSEHFTTDERISW